jgi:hypothetical protein
MVLQPCCNFLFLALLVVVVVVVVGSVKVNGFCSTTRAATDSHPQTALFSQKATTHRQQQIRIGDLLSDLPTPILLLELSLAEGAIKDSSSGNRLNNALEDPTRRFPTSTSLDEALFVHTKVTSTSKRDAACETFGSGKTTSVCEVDVSPDDIPGGAYLCIGLANHLVGGYYWARGMGIGACLPAHGIAFGSEPKNDYGDKEEEHKKGGDGELYWKKRGPGQDAKETTEESSNSNDGKRSEWADFVVVGDTVQLVPENALQVLTSSSTSFSTLIGMRRIGRPLGADPIVEMVWTRSNDDKGGWIAI